MILKNSVNPQTQLNASQVVTAEDLSAMMAFLRNFQMKYSRRRKAVKKKK